MEFHRYGSISYSHLRECHSLLQAHAELTLAKSPYDLGIRDGGRTNAEQAHYVKIKASKTLNSRHIFGWAPDDPRFLPPQSFAYDFVVLINRKYRTEDPLYREVWESAILPAAAELGIEIRGGYYWGWDLGHVQLSRKRYPATLATDDEIQHWRSAGAWGAVS